MTDNNDTKLLLNTEVQTRMDMQHQQTVKSQQPSHQQNPATVQHTIEDAIVDGLQHPNAPKYLWSAEDVRKALNTPNDNIVKYAFHAMVGFEVIEQIQEMLVLLRVQTKSLIEKIMRSFAYDQYHQQSQPAIMEDDLPLELDKIHLLDIDMQHNISEFSYQLDTVRQQYMNILNIAQKQQQQSNHELLERLNIVDAAQIIKRIPSTELHNLSSDEASLLNSSLDNMLKPRPQPSGKSKSDLVLELEARFAQQASLKQVHHTLVESHQRQHAQRRAKAILNQAAPQATMESINNATNDLAKSIDILQHQVNFAIALQEVMLHQSIAKCMPQQSTAVCAMIRKNIAPNVFDRQQQMHRSMHEGVAPELQQISERINSMKPMGNSLMEQVVMAQQTLRPMPGSRNERQKDKVYDKLNGVPATHELDREEAQRSNQIATPFEMTPKPE